VLEEGFVDETSFVLTFAGDGLYAGGFERPVAASVDVGIGIEDRVVNVCDPGADYGVGAGGCTALMRAWFEGYVQGGASGAVASLFKSDDLSVRPGRRLSYAFADDDAIGDDDGTDRWIG
jgi:hypothetical protein